jgi:hypothetical protein
LLSLNCPSFYNFSEEEKEEECEQLSISESVTCSSSGNTSSELASALPNILGEKKPCKKSADLHPGQGNLLQWNIFIGLNKTSLHFTK